MPEFNYNIEPYGVDYRCDDCNQGIMIYSDGNMKLSDPPKFTHRCTICGHEQDFAGKYPMIRYRIVE